ncbi:MAG: hypothetical protein M0037_00850 [Betaproteobacteria bacterium]|jgi:hypothetical protein|nr:hypothetical protein [Betaproteobacteria bacterium]
MDETSRRSNRGPDTAISELVDRFAAREILRLLDTWSPRMNARVLATWLEKIALRPADFDGLIAMLEREGMIAVERDEEVVLQLREKGLDVARGAVRHAEIERPALPA